MFLLIAPLFIALALGFATPSGAFYGPMIGQQKPVQLVLQAVAVELQPGHERALASLINFRKTLTAGTDNGWAKKLDSFHGRARYFDAKHLTLPEGGGIEIRPRDGSLPGRVRFVVAQRFADGSDTEQVLTIRLDRRVGFEEGYAVVPLEGDRRYLALAVELRR